MDVDLTRRAFIRHNLVNPLELMRDGQEALDYVTGWRAGDPVPSVILLDLKLPRTSGLEVLRVIRAHPGMELSRSWFLHLLLRMVIFAKPICLVQIRTS